MKKQFKNVFLNLKNYDSRGFSFAQEDARQGAVQFGTGDFLAGRLEGQLELVLRRLDAGMLAHVHVRDGQLSPLTRRSHLNHAV